MKVNIEKILLPYVCDKRKELKLAADYPALIIFDKFTGQGTENLLKLLEDNHIYFVMVPANCTDLLQPMDISVNKPAKKLLQQQFQELYAEEIYKQLDQKEGISPVDLRLSIVKPLGAQWMIKLYDYVKSKPDIIKNGFRGAGIADYLAN